MLPDVYFIAIMVFAIGSGMAVFLSKRLLHAVLGLTAAFIGSALFFLYLDQSFIALLQLFVFVGGLSTYLIVAVAGDESEGSMGIPRFIVLAVVIALGLSVVLFGSSLSAVPSGNSFLGAAGAAVEIYYPILFMLALLLFATVIGSVMIIKRFVRLVV